jgi:1,2-diacylglycerol-3-alpha-glucose alpha-1,2-glucosyltransferase
MKVCIYLELEEKLAQSGIGKAVENQRKALELNGVDWTSAPSEDFDIIHINTIGPKSLYLAKKMKLKGKKVVMHAHTLAEDFKNSFWFSNVTAPALKQYLKLFYNQADMVICATEYAKQLLREYGITKEIKIVSNGVDLKKFEDVDLKREDSRKMFSLEGIVPFSLGHVFARKGVRTFIRVAEHFPNTFAWFGRIYHPLLGSREMINLVSNAPKNVIFPGFVENVLAYSAGDIFFFPSKCELQGIVVLEAAASKKPILVRDIPVFDSWLTHNKDCLKAKNAGDFIVQLRELIKNKRLRQNLSRSAYHMVQEHSVENVGAELKEAYEYVLKA